MAQREVIGQDSDITAHNGSGVAAPVLRLNRIRLFRSHSRSHYRFDLGQCDQTATAQTISAATAEELTKRMLTPTEDASFRISGIIHSAANSSAI